MSREYVVVCTRCGQVRPPATGRTWCRSCHTPADGVESFSFGDLPAFSVRPVWTREEASAVGACIAHCIEEIADDGETDDRLRTALAKLQAAAQGVP